jgi:hypothetical protein
MVRLMHDVLQARRRAHAYASIASRTSKGTPPRFHPQRRDDSSYEVIGSLYRAVV